MGDRLDIRRALCALVCAAALSACGGGSTMPSPVATRALQTVWIANANGASAYTTGASSTSLTPIPNDVVDASTPNFGALPTNTGFPSALAFDARGNLWMTVAEYDENDADLYTALAFAVTPSVSGATPAIDLASVLAIRAVNPPTTIAFDATGNMWIDSTDPAHFNESLSSYHIASDLTPTEFSVSLYKLEPFILTSIVAFDRAGRLWTGIDGAYRSFRVAGGVGTTVSTVSTGCETSPVFDARDDMWCVDATNPDEPVIDEYLIPGGQRLGSFPIPKPASVDVSAAYYGTIGFDSNGTLWVLATGEKAAGGGLNVPSYEALIALSRTGNVLTAIPFPNFDAYAFVFAP